jgi:3-oxoacyl-[acyl-carrier protein] reductase
MEKGTNMTLQGKTALVTGASRGIGRAIALRLAKEGARVAVHYRDNEDKAQEVVTEIIDNGGAAIALQADIADLLEIRQMMGELEAQWKRLDILVNNAGGAKFAPLAEVTEDDFDAIFDLNVRGLFFTTQEAIRIMNNDGRIINISSGITRVNACGGSVYSGSKAAVEAFTRSWSNELGGRGITVNTVSPGMTETDLMRQVTAEDSREGLAAQSPFGRLGQPEDIADVVTFLCTSDARWLTAQNILANGGVG